MTRSRTKNQISSGSNTPVTLTPAGNLANMADNIIDLGDGIICFSYVDDIVFAFNKEQSDEVENIVASLSQTLPIEAMGELK